MADLNTIIKQFRLIHPTASISCNVTLIDGNRTHISVTIANENGPMSTVETITTVNTDEIFVAQGETTIRAIEYLGIFEKDKSFGDENKPVGSCKSESAPTHMSSRKAKRTCEPESEPEVTPEVENPQELVGSRPVDNLAEHEPGNAPDGMSEDTALATTESPTPENDCVENVVESHVGLTEGDELVERGSVNAHDGETPVSDCVAAGDGPDTSDALATALAVVLDITDPTRKVSMKEFIGKPMQEIATRRPAILRNILREADKGNVVCSETCLAAARIIAEAKVGN